MTTTSDRDSRGFRARSSRIPLSLLLLTVCSTGCVVEAEPVVVTERKPPVAVPDHIWPPRVGEAYPNLQLRNSLGERVALEAFKGRVILVEPIGMDCPACNAFAGGNRPGSAGFRGVRPQRGLPSVEEILRDYAGGASLLDDRLVLVHLLLYDRASRVHPAWRRHACGLSTSDSWRPRTRSYLSERTI